MKINYKELRQNLMAGKKKTETEPEDNFRASSLDDILPVRISPVGRGATTKSTAGTGARGSEIPIGRGPVEDPYSAEAKESSPTTSCIHSLKSNSSLDEIEKLREDSNLSSSYF